MKAVTCQHADFAVKDLPEPTPGPGQVRLEILRCGICGSDLHARHGIDSWAELARKVGYERLGRSDQPVVFGHEFSGAVAEYGPKTRRRIPAGAPVVALPLLRTEHGIDTIGLSQHAPGAYAEQMLVQESMMMPVPNGLPADVAALTEPLAVAWHAVQRSDIAKKDVAVVIGCGPIGLAVILCLKANGVRQVVASDFSPARRDLAARCGADVVVDPAAGTPFADSARHDHMTNAEDLFELGVGTKEKLDVLPSGWWHIWRLGEKLGAKPKAPVVFECVGVPGMISSIVDDAPIYSRVVVVGVCVGPDQFEPALAINKEIDLRFVLGYTPLEFRDTLHMLGEGKIDPRPLITGAVGLEGVEAAFDALAEPDVHAKILVDPRSDAAEPRSA
ncbi:MAG TPA: zinc-binding dehydrogenase [Vicinamibacterales bacterium]|nr:zinc-binding dehydrogenase [Vicinamibacterales bacterium]